MSDYETLAAGGPPGTTAGEPPAEPAAEARPQIGGPPARDRKTAGKSLAERIRPARSRAGAKGKPGAKRKPVHERVSLASLIEGGWGVLARLSHPLSEPLSRCLGMQAPVWSFRWTLSGW